MQGTWVSTVLRLGVGGESKAWGSQNPVPTPKAELGRRGPIWQQRNMAAWRREDKSGEQQAGPPRSPEKRGRSLKALTQGPKGSLSAMHHSKGETPLPQGHEHDTALGF